MALMALQVWGASLFDHARDFIHDRFRRRIDFRDQGGEVLAVLRLEIELRFLRPRRRKSGSFMVGLEGVAQHFQPVRRQVRRRHERAADALPGIEEFEQLAAPRRSRARSSTNGTPLSSGCGSRAALEQNRRSFSSGSSRAARFLMLSRLSQMPSTSPRSIARNTSAEDGKSADQLELHAEQLVERLRIGARAGAGAGVAEDQFLVVQVVHAIFTLRGVIGDADVGFLGRACRATTTWSRSKRAPGAPVSGPSAASRAMMPNTRAVLRRDVVDVARRHVAAGARHVLRHDGRIARQMPADMARRRCGPTGHSRRPARSR